MRNTRKNFFRHKTQIKEIRNQGNVTLLGENPQEKTVRIRKACLEK